MPETRSVVFVHGLWMTGMEATLFRHRLAPHGYAVRQFHYHSLSAAADTVLDALRAEVLAQPAPVHLIGHSLGGLIVLRLLERHPDLPVGRVVLLGAPVNGSQAAQGFMRLPGAPWLFGPMAGEELLAAAPRAWRHPAALGVIAGTHSLGLGRLVGSLSGPNDGTVAVEEARLDGATDTLLLPVSHVGLLLSEAVIEATACFLQHGAFSATGP
ncbi:MAG: alpha/beta fold hydrolase [Proteobacteria bacterium]|nr:alpha/beta fold hydrolase [Pseudomonadota bacterium]